MLVYCEQLNSICNKYTRVHKLVMMGAVSTLSRYLRTRKGLEEINSPNEFGYTPVMLSVMNNKSVETVATLVDNYANINAKDYKGNTPLMLAIMHNRGPEVNLIKLVTDLVKMGADTNVKNYNKRSLVDICYEKGYSNLMKNLLAYQKYILFSSK